VRRRTFEHPPYPFLPVDLLKVVAETPENAVRIDPKPAGNLRNVAGTAQAGATLTFDTGGWAGSPTSFAY